MWADSADDLGLIHGPPGTGKTRTLTAVVLAAVESRAATLVPLACAEKLVLAGDHRQLPPYTAGEAGSDQQRPSLFETLLDRYGESAAVRLRRQYRMHEQIAAFPNETFYDGELETAEAVRAVRRLLDAGLSPGDIGVITPYRGQRAVLRDRLESLPELHSTEVASAREATLSGGGVTRSDSVETHSGNADVHSGSGGADSSSEATRHRGDTERDHLVVDTVDAFQGGERTAVVVSFVRSGDGNRSGFLTAPSVGPRRLNVALTRARRRLVLVGDWETLGSTAVDREASESRADVYADLAAWLEANGLVETAE